MAPPEKRTKRVRRRGHRALDRGGAHHGLGDQGVVDAEERAGHDRCRRRATALCVGADAPSRRGRARTASARPSTVGTMPKRRCSSGATHTEVIASSRPQPKKIQPTCERGHVQRERRERQQREEAQVVEQRGQRDRSAGPGGAAPGTGRPATYGVPPAGSSAAGTRSRRSATVISTATPKNGRAPGDRAELAADERAGRDAEAESGLEEDDRLRRPSRARTSRSWRARWR